MKAPLILLAFTLSVTVQAQSFAPRNGPAGTISVGGRSSFSLFNSGDHSNAGTGIGGQLRVRLSDRVNTDWFYDYFSGALGEHAHRMDQHIGWSVLFYLREPTATRQLVQPYILAGHCFDYTKQQANSDPGNYAERWSSAVQAGLGTHFNLTDRFDLSLVGQYMMHLGTDVHAEEHDGIVEFHTEEGAGLEGHLLLHLSFSYKIFDAW